jgi:hypothetical protein
MSLPFPPAPAPRNAGGSDPRSDGASQERRLLTYFIGLVLLFLSPALCCHAVNALAYPRFYAEYGRGPAKNTSKISEGMTTEAVIQLCGQPHKKYREDDGTTRWTYFEDPLGFNYTGVHFDKQGRVTNTWIP